jgi:hypothetical protein
MNILYDPNNLDDILQLYNLDRHLQLMTLMVNNSKQQQVQHITTLI